MTENFQIGTTLRSRAWSSQDARLFETIKRHVLGKTYTLSLTFIGDARSQTLNKTYRRKDYPTNVLSFPLDAASGEILINLALAKREARKFGTTQARHTTYLFIHGLLHLKGHTHGDTMEKQEKALLKRFLE